MEFRSEEVRARLDWVDGKWISTEEKGLSEQAINTFRVMRADGIKPSILVLNSLINAFGEDRRDADVFSVLQFMKENDLKPDVMTYTTLMKALIRVEKFEKLQGNCIEPRPPHLQKIKAGKLLLLIVLWQWDVYQRYYEIWGMNAKNINGEVDCSFMEEWHEGRMIEVDGTMIVHLNENERARCWRSQPFCNLLLGCLVIVFILPWFFRV